MVLKRTTFQSLISCTFNKFKLMKQLIISLTILIGSLNVSAQNFSLSAGTDIPYQHYLAVNLELKKIDFSYRTGILTPPYSDAILDIINVLGTDDIYIDLLDASFDFGWTNSIGTYYKFGKKKDWYVGGEIRYDYLTAADAPQSIIQTITGQPISLVSFLFSSVELKLGLKMLATGFRFGKSFTLSSNNKHHLKTEISGSKYILTQSVLELQGLNLGLNLEPINKELNSLLWEDVFKKYGYIGGLGIAYSYSF